MKISNKVILVLTMVALGLLSCPGNGMAQAIIPVVDLGDHVWAHEIEEGCLLGGKMNDRWLKPKEMAELLQGGETYRLYTLTRFIGNASGSKPEKSGKPGGSPEYVVQMAPLPVPQKEIIAIGGQWDALPRVPRRTNPDQVVYKEAVAEVLKKKGLKNPKIKITQVVRIDLDGDGVEEVLITADTYGDKLYRHLQKRGSYSLVLLRKVINGKVETLVIEEDYFPSPREYGVPYRYWVGAVLDVDGDGVMEIVLHAMYYEGGWTSVYRVEGNKVEQVLVAGWGV
ncbi:MAG: VCBS repeat-containing protein [Proteobacteria bacterium]|nr:VCBS repeat-containing protein [Pseudomonadota bacterium]